MQPNPDHTRALISISGADRVAFLQGLLTNDVTRLAAEQIQFAALLSPQGKILHDLFLIHQPDAILLDVRAEDAALLQKRLTMYKLRAQVTITAAATATFMGTLADPRHPDLPHRHYPPVLHHSPRTTHHSLTLGIPECGRDFAPDTVTALDAGYDLLHAISFTKGCYVGQEITARMHYKNIARKGFFMLEREGNVARLALLKFEDVYGVPTTLPVPGSAIPVTVDNVAFHARLPAWMGPKLRQFHAGTH